MNHPVAPNPQNSVLAALKGFAPWQQLKNKSISYLTLPLLVMATCGIRHSGDRLEISAGGLFAAGDGRHLLWHRADRRDDSRGGVAEVAAGDLDGVAARAGKRAFMLVSGCR